jgi:hypothetical protein
MTWQEFKQRTEPLAVQLGAEWDLPTWKLYHRAVEKVPLPMFDAALQEAAETRTKFPSAAQLREMAEGHRKALLAANPYDGCAECEDKIGWRTVVTGNLQGVERCPCRDRWLAKLDRLGVGRTPLALPPVEAAHEFSRIGE